MEVTQELEILEKKNKRAAANVNERRRMQNINSGFEALRGMIDIQNSSKLSKSAILRHTVEMMRNLVSENHHLREQNTFMMSLYCNQTQNSKLLAESPPKLIKQESHDSAVSDMQTPSKKAKPIIKSEENSSLNNNFPYSRKSPKKNSSSYAVDKLLASPKRLTRSSVIQQNYAYPLQNYPAMESPTRRSLRLLEKDALLTPPSSGHSRSSCSSEEDQRNILNSPTTRSKIVEHRLNCLLTPEAVKGIPARSAKRSLDAIIDAIDQIEKS